MKLRITIMTIILIGMTALVISIASIFPGESYNYSKYDPTVIAFMNPHHSYA